MAVTSVHRQDGRAGATAQQFVGERSHDLSLRGYASVHAAVLPYIFSSAAKIRRRHPRWRSCGTPPRKTIAAQSSPWGSLSLGEQL